MALLVEGGEKRATTAVPAELGAPTCNYRNRHGETLTVPRGPGPPATDLRREMKRMLIPAHADQWAHSLKRSEWVPVRTKCNSSPVT